MIFRLCDFVDSCCGVSVGVLGLLAACGVVKVSSSVLGWGDAPASSGVSLSQSSGMTTS